MDHLPSSKFQVPSSNPGNIELGLGWVQLGPTIPILFVCTITWAAFLNTRPPATDVWELGLHKLGQDSLLFAKFSAPPSQDKVFLRKQGRVTQRIYVVSISSIDWSSEEALDLISLSLLHTRFALHLLHAILVSRSHPQTEFTSLFHAIKIKKELFWIRVLW
ncbi:hypothetical protein L3X38_029815 [Prunus dulcis]|uniref:Uncharacterized protein n=1 Tax=Prunus dulcis TaxID=3755 RepID=A0AAD4VUA4_PRUDU|nr:hypothetical protein L3X38_029815 [Prunus dulcis]